MAITHGATPVGDLSDLAMPETYSARTRVSSSDPADKQATDGRHADPDILIGPPPSIGLACWTPDELAVALDSGVDVGADVADVAVRANDHHTSALEIGGLPECVGVVVRNDSSVIHSGSRDDRVVPGSGSTMA